MSINMASTGLYDSRAGYGPVSRFLHWGMALLFAWQFTSVLLRVFAEDTPIEGFFWSTHYSVGFTICILAVLRGVWGLLNLRVRAVPRDTFLKRAAPIGQTLMYVLMIVVPTLAIMRAVGGNRGFSVYGIQLVAPGGEPNPVLTEPGNVAHGILGWTLLTLIVGHIALALLHGLVWRDPTLDRMTKGWSAK